MMAQDFQDLTGQVIKKIVALAQDMESQTMGVLIDIMPEIRKTEQVNSLLNGPVVNAEGQADVVVNQQQVDDLLGSLGF
jgi:chemotaxis protein CheZ